MSRNPARRLVFEVAPTAREQRFTQHLNRNYLVDETPLLRALARAAYLNPERGAKVQERALGLVEAVRSAQRERPGSNPLDSFLQQYSLASQEGVLLMCLAEALLRIPDAATADRLIADKIGGGEWQRHLGAADSLLVNASTWGLLLTGRIVALDGSALQGERPWYAALAAKLGEPVIRTALRQAMRILGRQFVMGRDIDEALQRSQEEGSRAYRHSFDMLGESALTAADAQRYLDSYRDAIVRIGASVAPGSNWLERPGISVKLSALYPRFEPAQARRALGQLAPRLLQLTAAARDAGIALTVDAEEADRLQLSLQAIDAVLDSGICADYAGFGLAVQAYQKRAPDVIAWLSARARQAHARLNLRLVKGAYWDSEIKRAQERGLDGFPVYTRKVGTDVAYLACVRQLAAVGDCIYPQFATHNAHTISYVLEVIGNTPFEFQRLHGMGEALYAQLVPQYACRVYAPVGAHEDLLPYLVRRLLENGANSSFVNRIVDDSVSAADVVRDPVTALAATQAAGGSLAHPRIRLPALLYGDLRRNSRGVNLADPQELQALQAESSAAIDGSWNAAPVLVAGSGTTRLTRGVTNPARGGDVIGTISDTTSDEVAVAVTNAVAAVASWDALGGLARAQILERASDLFEARRGELLARCVLEGGRTLPDSINEVREAIDYIRYYAAQVREDWSAPHELAGPVGERNSWRWCARGVFACISPWNFPVAIFTGQIAAALAAGNAVLAKPAAQTPLTGACVIALLHEAGVPRGVLQFLPGDAAIGAALVSDSRVAGVAFTGSTATARAIQRSLAARDGAIATFIAETGGINVMIADSSALPEQLVADIVASAFNSAGQRCSAARVLYVQDVIADRVLALLAGAMDELVLGDPALLVTDVGPVIDAAAHAALERHAAKLAVRASWQHRAALPEHTDSALFFAPLAVEIDAADVPRDEVFGPVLHIVRFAGRDIHGLIDTINGWGYGLTLGIHTRVEQLADALAARAQVGNVYINRNMVGAVVGVQPFGGRGLSGTGPKAGGENYLARFATEQTVSINTAAVGGNAGLLSLS
jgi:RHH-type transcriptional regulator, proline utilization regulon repressor / proline dehydrogenase / delta 1-pyrroline-5-carboxylate dehydrogenase